MAPSKSICAIVLAFIFLLHQAQGRIVIGYRTVSRAEAMSINQNNKPTRDPFYDNISPDQSQLGPGFYMTNEAATWYTSDDEWFCVIKADAQKFNSIGKVWIPRNYWMTPPYLILGYIRTWVNNPEKALRFSYIYMREYMIQMLIPTNVVNNDDLDLWGRCFDTAEGLTDYSDETVNWESWGISGEAGKQGEEPSYDSDSDLNSDSD